MNLHLTGEAEEYINALVRRGLAANKTEAIRLLIVRGKERELALEEERRDLEMFQRASMKMALDNRKDDEAAKFYERMYLRGKKK